MWPVLLALTCAQLMTSSAGSPCSPSVAGCTCDGTKAVCAQANITSIPDGLPPGITELDIDGATLRELRHIPNYVDLTKLGISHSGLRYIAPGAFQNMTKLVHLILDNNELPGLWSDTFTGLKALRTLSLEGNPLHAVQNDTFRGTEMPNLQTLILRKCNLFKVEARAFAKLINLKELIVNQNHLGDVPLFGSTNGNLETLEVLDLSDNQISSITADPFSQLGNLKKLNLASNKIHSLSVNSFSGLMKLRSLYLRNNEIVFSPNHTLSALETLRDLDLSYNKLRHLVASQLPPNLTSVHLHHNPWRCDCHLVWMLHTQAVRTTNSEIPSFTCDSPEDLKGVKILALNPINMPCDQPRPPLHTHSQGGLKLSVVLGIVLSVLFTGAAIYVGYVYYRKYRRKRALQYNSITRETEMFGI